MGEGPGSSKNLNDHRRLPPGRGWKTFADPRSPASTSQIDHSFSGKQSPFHQGRAPWLPGNGCKKPLLIQDLQLPHLRLTTLSLESNHHFIKGELLGCLVMGAKFGNCCVDELPNFEKTIIPRCTAWHCFGIVNESSLSTARITAHIPESV